MKKTLQVNDFQLEQYTSTEARACAVVALLQAEGAPLKQVSRRRDEMMGVTTYSWPVPESSLATLFRVKQ